MSKGTLEESAGRFMWSDGQIEIVEPEEATREAASVKFSPDQPRVPAGSPEGGQFGEGGGGGSQSVGSTPKPATEQKPTQAAKPASKDVPAPKLSANQVRAFNEYSEAIGFDINQSLREDANLSNKEAAVAKQLSTAIEKHGTLPHPVETYRAMSWSHKEDHDAFVSQLSEGRTLQLKGFTSTSLDKDFVQNEFTGRPGGSLIMEIKAIKGIRMTGKLTQHEEQKELLLNHKSQFRVTGTRKEGNMTFVSLEQIK